MTTLYHVHLYREMRLTFSGILASSPEAAAEIVRQLPSDEAVSIEDCDGEDLAVLVDAPGDDRFEKSVIIDFEGERARKAARKMQEALRAFLEADRMAEECREWKWENLDHAFRLAREVIDGEREGARPANRRTGKTPCPQQDGFPPQAQQKT